MAAAEAVGVLALGQLWFDRTFAGAAFDTDTALLTEIIRHASWLAKTWDSDTAQVLVGVGDQLAKDGGLATYEDFGTADYALQARHHLVTG